MKVPAFCGAVETLSRFHSRLNSLRKMSSVEDRYYKIHRILLTVLGIWPYQNSRWTCVQALFMTLLYLSALFVQLAVFITHECTLKVVVDVLSFAFPTTFMLFMYNVYYFNVDVFKEALERIYTDWRIITNKQELVIMDYYASMAKLFTQTFSLLTALAIFMTITSHAVPMTLDVILPLNKPRAQNLHIVVEYFVDPSEYYTYLVIHMTVFISLGVLTVMGTAAMLLGVGFHACGLFKLANYRMEIIMDIDISHISSPEKDQIIRERIIYAVNGHRRAFEFCEFLIANLSKWFLVVIVVGVSSMSINLFRFLQVMINFKISELVDVFIPSALVFIHLCYLFFGNHIGQQVTDRNDDIFNTIYSLPWYIAPLNIQKLFLFLLQRGNKSFYLTIQGLFDASYPGFTSLTATSISYFTVLYSIQ